MVLLISDIHQIPGIGLAVFLLFNQVGPPTSVHGRRLRELNLQGKERELCKGYMQVRFKRRPMVWFMAQDNQLLAIGPTGHMIDHVAHEVPICRCRCSKFPWVPFGENTSLLSLTSINDNGTFNRASHERHNLASLTPGSRHLDRMTPAGRDNQIRLPRKLLPMCRCRVAKAL